MSERSARVAIGLIWLGRSIVVGQRAADVDLPGYDEFPGGKCRPDETPEETVVRECREETGLEVTVTALRLRLEHTYPHGRLELQFFDCSILSVEQPRLLPPFRWVPVEQLSELHFPDANAPVLELIA